MSCGNEMGESCVPAGQGVSSLTDDTLTDNLPRVEALAKDWARSALPVV